MKKKLILKPGREKSLLRRHPWIFSGAVARMEGQAQSGDTIDIISSAGAWLGRAAFSPKSQMVARIWSFDEDQPIDASFFRQQIARAAQWRAENLQQEKAACRLVNAESDGLPGVTIDRYADYLVCQFLTAGAEHWGREIIEALQELFPGKDIYERSDVEVRGKEDLPLVTGVLAGEAPPDLVEISEGSCRFYVDIQRGHKTGFYLDQRENRAQLAKMSEGANVLNVFAYTGGFGISALVAGAESVCNLDTSGPSLDLGRRNAELNGIDPARVENVQGDAFQVLRRFRDEGRTFDIVVLDPPKFAESQSQVERAARGYKDINLLGFKLLRPGGLLFTFSCSGLMPADLFQKIVADAALDAGCEAQMIGRLSQAPDHPVLLSFPEGFYLKGLICKKISQ